MKAVEPNRHTNSINEEFAQDLEKLANAIIQGDVILIVGNNFEFNTDNNSNILSKIGDDVNFSDYILYIINNTYGTNAQDFSELENDPLFHYNDSTTGIRRKANIYNEINHVINSAELSIDDVSEPLKRLLSTGFFRFVITTSFSPLVEIAMKHQWGEENVDVLNIYDSDLTKRDIDICHSSINTPTVYYIHGKAGSYQKFVATDNDCLRVMKSIINEMSNSNLMDFTSEKYLLSLGCNHDDWLFRFIWYALKTNENNIRNGYIGREKRDEKLERFLSLNGIYLQHDSKQFATEIYDALLKAKETQLFKDPRNNEWDVFISYSRKDGDVASKIYQALTEVGLKVWYDKTNLGGKGEIFMDYIKEAIRSSKVFMPILTTTITKQRKEIHPYRLEWSYAINEGRIKQSATVSCIPVIESDYDIESNRFSDKLPEEFTKRDGYIYDKACPDFGNWAEKIKELILNS